MTQQNVIRKSDKILLRFGYCDFEHDGAFDSDTEEIIELNFVFADFPIVNYRYNVGTETFEVAE